MAIFSDQVPVGSGFAPKTDGADVIADLDLAGKTAIVTGGYSGIGLETVKALTAKGVTVVVPVRSPEKAAENLAAIDGDVQTGPLDLGDVASVRRFGESMVGELDRLDYLINNAGIMASPEARVGPGWESQFGINYMSHFALTKTLWPLIEATEGSRMVALSSTAHKASDIRWDDVQFDQEPYDKWQAYGQAKPPMRSLPMPYLAAWQTMAGWRSLFTRVASSRRSSVTCRKRRWWQWAGSTKAASPPSWPKRVSRHPKRVVRPRCGQRPRPCWKASRACIARVATLPNHQPGQPGRPVSRG